MATRPSTTEGKPSSRRRRKLLPGMREVMLPNGEERIEVVVDTGLSPATGKRRQARRRFKTIEEARAYYVETAAAVRADTYVHQAPETVREYLTGWLDGRRTVRASTLASYRNALAPVVEHYGAKPVQKLTRHDLDVLVDRLMAGTAGNRADGTPRRPWKGRTVAAMLTVLGHALDDAAREGKVTRNVAGFVDRPPVRAAEMATWTAAEVERVLKAAATDRLQAAWHLALCGLRRGEIAGLRWADVDLAGGTLMIRATRVIVGTAVVDEAPKTERGKRTLPLTDDLARVLRAARKREAAERLALGEAWTDSGMVVVDEIGRPISPAVLSERFRVLTRRAGVPPIRLHDARHTCGTLMHLQGVPVAVISAWLGHSSPAFTMRTYVHSQADALRDAAGVLDGVFRGATTA